MADDTPSTTRRARLWEAAEARGVPLRTIIAAAVVVVVVYLAGKLIYRLRDVLLLVIVAGFIAALLNPIVVALQRWRIRRHGRAVAVVVAWGLGRCCSVIPPPAGCGGGYPVKPDSGRLAHIVCPLAAGQPGTAALGSSRTPAGARASSTRA